MNKIVPTVCVLALVVSGANTALLLQMGAKMKETGEKAASAAKELEKVGPMLHGLSEKIGALPADKLPPGPGDLKPKRPGDSGTETDPAPKLLPKPGERPLPPGPFPNK